MSKIFDEAIRYEKLGLSVIPVRKDKKPFIRWQQYQNEKADAHQIREWWGRWPEANLAIVTGAVSNLLVVDIDAAAGFEALAEKCPELATLTTPTAKTPGGGLHLFFQHQEGIGCATRFLPETDLRAEGGFIITPPSRGGNGREYTWMPGASLEELEPALAPCALISIFNNKALSTNTNVEVLREEGASPANKSQHLTTFDNIDFTKGQRDNSLFHVANCLLKGGMDHDNILKCLEFIGRNCKPPFSEKEIQTKVESAYKRAKSRDQNLTQEVRDFILTTSGNFLTTNVYEVTTLSTLNPRDTKKKISVILGRFVKEGLIERVGRQNGCFRRIEGDCEPLDFKNAQTQTLAIKLPFGIDKKIELMPGNIVLLAGEPNAGKTAFLLNLIKMNQEQFEIHYFNSEMGGGELRKRLEKFGQPFSSWTFNGWERSENFGDVIKAGSGKINVIDFLEVHRDFYEVGGMLAEIHTKLKGAVAVVALQKNKGVDTGLGGFRSLEKPRLALAMEPGKLKIVKAKNWAGEINPNGLVMDFKLVQGCHFREMSEWRRE